tara:strand:- start:68 stop:355 length:288 start_codon:yes stop_codon:yes gene_type:complete
MKEDTEAKLEKDFHLLNMSLEWWKKNANQMIGKIELLEDKFANDTATEEDRRIYKELIQECDLLIARGQVENQELEKMEGKLEKHFNESDDSRKA